MAETLIYLRITGREVDCWTPAMAIHLSHDVYRVTQVLGEERTEFKAGETVRCEMRGFPDGSEALCAVATAPES